MWPIVMGVSHLNFVNAWLDERKCIFNVFFWELMCGHIIIYTVVIFKLKFIYSFVNYK